MPKTLLAVDDSVTMRKVLEITFASDDFRVLGAENSQKALAQLSEEPLAAVIDTSLDGDDGYALAKQIRARDSRIAIVLLASRYNPYDANRGREAGADDYADKPFDTQSLLEKVKKAIVARDAQRNASAPPAASAQATAPGPVGTTPFLGTPQPRPVVTGAVPSRGPAPAGPRAHTLSFDSAPPAAAPQPSAPNPFAATVPSVQRVVPPAAVTKAPAPSVGQAPAPKANPAASQHNLPTAAPPAAPPVGGAPAAPMMAPAAAPPGAATVFPAAIGNGHLAGKLDGLGLTAQQVEAVLSLSRDLVEKVVWEVVPLLAETMIREEIARLTKEG